MVSDEKVIYNSIGRNNPKKDIIKLNSIRKSLHGPCCALKNRTIKQPKIKRQCEYFKGRIFD